MRTPGPEPEETETGHPVDRAQETQVGRTVPQVPDHPGQRYPAVPGRPGEPPLPGAYATPPPWTPPPWTPPPLPAPRPAHTGRWIVGLSAVIVVALALLGGGTWLITRALSGPVVPAGYRTLSTGYLDYAVPPDWTPAGTDATRALGVTFTGGADAPGYTCRGDGYKRGVATSALVGSDEDPATIARQFALQLGRSFYTSTAGRAPDVRLADPRPVTLGDATGAVVEATATTPTDDGCLATTGTVLVLAAPATGGGTAVLVVNGDVAGGPATPPAVDRAVLEEIVGSAALPG